MRAAAVRQATRLGRCALTRLTCAPAVASAQASEFASYWYHLFVPRTVVCRHAQTKAGNRKPPPAYVLPALSSFPSLAAFTQHVVTSRFTPAAVKTTLTSARSLLGPDAYELLMSLLTATQPTPADISAALAEVRPFALEHDKERRQAKLRLVQTKRTQQRGQPQQSFGGQSQQSPLDERAMTQLHRALVGISKYITPAAGTSSGGSSINPPTHGARTQRTSSSVPPPPTFTSSTASTVIAPPLLRASSPLHNPTRLFLAQLSALLPPLHFQALLRCFIVHSTTPLSNLKRQERHLATIRDIVAAAAVRDDNAWQNLYRHYKALRRREALDESVCAEMLKEVDQSEIRKLLPQAAEIERSMQERRSRTAQQSDTETKEADRRQLVKEKQVAAEQERMRLNSIIEKLASLSLPAAQSLPAYYPGSPIPIDAAALSASLLPPTEWTVAAMRCLEQLQAECHPLTYWHFRSYMAQLASGPAAVMAASTSASSVLSNVKSYCSLLFPDSHLLRSLALQLPTFLSLSAPPLVQSKRPPSPTLASLPSVPSFDLPLERHAFLCHFHREAVPVQSSELFLAWWRWQLTMEEAERSELGRPDEQEEQRQASGVYSAEVDPEASEEMRKLDEEIGRLQRNRRGRRRQSNETEGLTTAPTTAAGEKKTVESKPRKETHSRMTVLNAAVRLFGDSSPLVFLLRQHISALTFAEWSEVRLRLGAESEHHDYIGFFLDESSTAAAAPTVFHQRYKKPTAREQPGPRIRTLAHSSTCPLFSSTLDCIPVSSSSSASHCCGPFDDRLSRRSFLVVLCRAQRQQAVSVQCSAGHECTRAVVRVASHRRCEGRRAVPREAAAQQHGQGNDGRAGEARESSQIAPALHWRQKRPPAASAEGGWRESCVRFCVLCLSHRAGQRVGAVVALVRFALPRLLHVSAARDCLHAHHTRVAHSAAQLFLRPPRLTHRVAARPFDSAFRLACHRFQPRHSVQWRLCHTRAAQPRRGGSSMGEAARRAVRWAEGAVQLGVGGERQAGQQQAEAAGEGGREASCRERRSKRRRLGGARDSRTQSSHAAKGC